MRSLQAASNQSRRDQQRAQRALARGLDKVDRECGQVLDRARVFEGKLERDPLKALSLRYTEGIGFESDPFPIQTAMFSGSFHLTQSRDESEAGGEFTPPSFDTITSSVRPLALMITRWATFVAIEVSNGDADFTMRTNWVKKSDPQASAVFLIDPDSSEYYYPIASSLGGGLAPGHPLDGIIAFQPFRRPARRVELHGVDVPLQSGKGGKHSFRFEYALDVGHDEFSWLSNPQSLPDQVRALLDSEANKMRNMLTSAAKRQSSGCLVMLAIPPMAIGAALAATGLL